MPGLYDVRVNRNSFDGVLAGSPATIDIPDMYGQIHEANIIYSEGGVLAPEATIVAGIEKVEMVIDGRVYSEYDPADIFMLEKFRGEDIDDGYLPLRFADQNRRNLGAVESTSFIPAAHPTPQFRVSIAAGRVAPSLKNTLLTEGLGSAGRAKLAANPATARRPLIKHRKNIIDVLTSGSTPNRFAFKNGGERVRGWHLMGDNIDKVVIKWNNQERWTFDDPTDLNRLVKSSGFVPQPNVWHITPEAFNGSVYASIATRWGKAKKEGVIDFEIFTSNTNNVTLLTEEYSWAWAKRVGA